MIKRMCSCNLKKMLAEGTFPLKNIAYLLFLDIVELFSRDSTSQMRYSEETKKFWRDGMKLFKGKFLRFISEIKNSRLESKTMETMGKYCPLDSKVNFAVPNRHILDKMVASPVKTSSPGILSEMIYKISSGDPD